MNESMSTSPTAGLYDRSKPIVVDGFELIALPQREPATWPGKTSTPSDSSSRRRSEWKRPSAPSFAPDREIRSSRVADEERVAREDQPGLVGAGAVDDREAGVLRAMPRGVNRPQDDLPQLELEAVGQRVVRVLRLGGRMDRDWDAVLECEPTMPGKVVGVGVGLDDADDLDPALRRRREHGRDRVRGIDDHGDAGILVADQVGRTAEVVVQELLEQHDL